MAEKVLFSWSGGKDSTIALYEVLKSEKYEISALLTMIFNLYPKGNLLKSIKVEYEMANGTITPDEIKNALILCTLILEPLCHILIEI
jgi:7-cyano-7-deazaguanine synthase in queuosine biosynthesis